MKRQGNNMQHSALTNRYYLEGKVAFLEGKSESPYPSGPEKNMFLAGIVEMREELRILRENLRMQARDRR